MVSAWPEPLPPNPPSRPQVCAMGKRRLRSVPAKRHRIGVRSSNAAYEVSKHTLVSIAVVPHTTACSGWQHTKNMCCEEA